jgi:hypothetical protein
MYRTEARGLLGTGTWASGLDPMERRRVHLCELPRRVFVAGGLLAANHRR